MASAARGRVSPEMAGRGTPPAKPGLTRRLPRLYSPQDSLLDSSRLGDLWGFVNLFWLTISWYGVRTLWWNYSSTGQPVDLRILLDLGVSIERLFVADFAMILSLYVCLPLEKAQIAGWISRRTGVWLQHIYQTAFFFFWTLLIWRSDWTFFSAGSFVMHMFTMLMKMHSYLSTNRVLSGKLKELAKLKQERSKLGVDEKEIQESINQHILELQDDLFPPGATPYPQSVNFRNFTDFLRVPALVYQLDYPRTEKIRWGYVVEKLAGFAGTVVLAYIVISTFILPNLQAANDISVVELIGQLWFPMLFVYLLIFLMIWEYLVNVFAELSRFADRNFYDAWWNSTSFEHFARTWNKPVHYFLLHHVYGETRRSGISKAQAAFFTFLLSSILHEVVLILVTRKFRPVLFIFQMSQLIFIRIAEIPFFKARSRFTNACWWFALSLGFPVIGILYVRDFTLNK